MFDIAWTEILIVATIAIIVVGPKELPGMLRAFGKTFSQVRRTAREFQSTFNDALRDAERQAGLDEVRKDIQSVDPTKDLRKGISDAKKALGGKITDPSKTETSNAPEGDPQKSDAQTPRAEKPEADKPAVTEAKVDAVVPLKPATDDAATTPVDTKLAATPTPAPTPEPAATPDEAAQAAPATAKQSPVAKAPKLAPTTDEPDAAPRAAAGADRR
ncbi:MAG: Sec-independent protein translocase protein TatB [Pseudomonadota bacterium]